MPDRMLILEAMAAAAVTAAAAVLLCGWPWRTPRPARASAGCVLGVGIGFFLGCWLLAARPHWLPREDKDDKSAGEQSTTVSVAFHWPPREDQDRLLLILLPAVMAVELVGALAGRLRWLAWPLRLVIAVGAARVLLHNTTYLADLAGPDSREWTPAQTWKILAGMGAALAVVWAALVLLVRRAPGRSVPLAVALACAAAAVTVMHSGYASGGQVGLPLAAALAGAVAASLVLSGPPAMEGALGLAVVGLFALLVIGRFFGELTTLNAALLFFAPLLCWLPELPPRFRGVARVVMVAVPVAVALLLAHQKFAEDSARTAPGPQEPSTQDYLDIGK